jgi:hypothetical protein
VLIIAYLSWDCEDIEYACEDCIDAYIEKSEKQHLKRLKIDLSNADDLFNCRECETVIEICCNCDDTKCDHRIAKKPGSEEILFYIRYWYHRCAHLVSEIF